MKYKAIITGVSGQDGAYLSQLLLEQGYKVIGLVRPGQNINELWRLKSLRILEDIQIHPCDLTNRDELCNCLNLFNPAHIYNLAAQSSVNKSFGLPLETFEFNVLSLLNIVELMRLRFQDVKLYHASSSEMFGAVSQLPIVEDMAFHPLSPYAVSKAAAHFIAKNYRESYGLFIACGILFNHESPLRPKNFFIKKVICEAIEVKKGQRKEILLGNINVSRDFGYAPHYVKAMHAMLLPDTPSDYIVCSGVSIALVDIVKYICAKVGIDYSVVIIDETLLRPLEIEKIYGDNAKACKELRWQQPCSFFDVLDILIEHEHCGELL